MLWWPLFMRVCVEISVCLWYNFVQLECILSLSVFFSWQSSRRCLMEMKTESIKILFGNRIYQVFLNHTDFWSVPYSIGNNCWSINIDDPKKIFLLVLSGLDVIKFCRGKNEWIGLTHLYGDTSSSWYIMQTDILQLLEHIANFHVTKERSPNGNYLKRLGLLDTDFFSLWFQLEDFLSFFLFEILCNLVWAHLQDGLGSSGLFGLLLRKVWTSPRDQWEWRALQYRHIRLLGKQIKTDGLNPKNDSSHT